MFSRILVPVDLADRHTRALEIAAGLVDRETGEIALVHVIETIPGLGPDEDRAFYDRLERRAREALEACGRILTDAAVRWRGEVVYGARTPEVLRLAESLESDLIVITSHAVLEDEAPRLGSVSHQVGVLSRCPVLLVK